MDFLNDAEKLELSKFADNEVMYNAVKKVLLSGVYFEGVLEPGKPVVESTKNFALVKAISAIQGFPGITDENLGQSIRADAQSLRTVELAYQQLEKFKTTIEIPTETTDKTGR